MEAPQVQFILAVVYVSVIRRFELERSVGATERRIGTGCCSKVSSVMPACAVIRGGCSRQKNNAVHQETTKQSSSFVPSVLMTQPARLAQPLSAIESSASALQS